MNSLERNLAKKRCSNNGHPDAGIQYYVSNRPKQKALMRCSSCGSEFYKKPTTEEQEEYLRRTQAVRV